MADVRLLAALVFLVRIIRWQIEKTGDYYSIQSARAKGSNEHQNDTHETVFETS